MRVRVIAALERLAPAGTTYREGLEKEICDSTKHTEAILAVSADSREQADQLADAALAAGAAPANEPMDHGVMYGRSFHDPDGHLWEVIWMDPSTLKK